MASMDVFKGDAFSTFELTQAINAVPYVPSFLESLNLFEPVPVRTEFFAIEKRDNTLNLVQTTKRGAAPTSRTDDKRDLRYFPTVRVANHDRLNASEIQNIRAFGSDSELLQVQDEVMRKMVNLQRHQNLTHENMRLGAIQGIVKDADGSTIRNWYSEWGVSQPAEVTFAFTTATAANGTIRGQCAAVVRAMARASKGAWIDGQSYVIGLCDDTFFDGLISNPETRATYLNQQEASQLLSLASIVHYSIAYVALFALPLFGSAALRRQLPRWLKVAAAAGIVSSLVALLISVYPVVDVVSRAAFAEKICAVVVISNMTGVIIYRLGRRNTLE